MQHDDAEVKLGRLLEIRFCDAKDSKEHEILLKTLAATYFKNFDFAIKAKTYNALANKSRLEILNLLTFREMCVCELTAALNMTQPNLTYHLKKLENVGIIEHEKEGKWIYYSLASREALRQIGVH